MLLVDRLALHLAIPVHRGANVLHCSVYVHQFAPRERRGVQMVSVAPRPANVCQMAQETRTAHRNLPKVKKHFFIFLY